MERDVMISHGASNFLKEKTFVLSDMYKIHICNNCGIFTSVNPRLKINTCKCCDGTEFSQIEIPYACKLLFQELIAMGIGPRIFPKK